MSTPKGVLAGASSFDIAPAEILDPVIFDGERMRLDVRLALTGTLFSYLDSQYSGREQWLRVWLAGSGASFRWHSALDMKDLDVLLGVDFVGFRQANPSHAWMGNNEIAKMMNDRMRRELWPSMKGWHGNYEVTFYVNPGSWDIRTIRPYAAYDMLADEWVVPPSKNPPQVAPEYQRYAMRMQELANQALERYSRAWTDLRGSAQSPHRIEYERRFHQAVDNAVDIYDSVHEGRRVAFTPTGGGYDDPANYLWQAGKKAGWIPALRQLKEYHQRLNDSGNISTYGMALPTADTLTERAVRAYQGVN